MASAPAHGYGTPTGRRKSVSAIERRNDVIDPKIPRDERLLSGTPFGRLRIVNNKRTKKISDHNREGVLTAAGAIDLEVPRDRLGRFELRSWRSTRAGRLASTTT